MIWIGRDFFSARPDRWALTLRRVDSCLESPACRSTVRWCSPSRPLALTLDSNKLNPFCLNFLENKEKISSDFDLKPK